MKNIILNKDLVTFIGLHLLYPSTQPERTLHGQIEKDRKIREVLERIRYKGFIPDQIKNA